jgi:hypothetical protein
MPDIQTTAVADPSPAQSDSRAPLPANWRRGFWSLIVTQFQTGFNDNALKFLVVYIIIGMSFTKAQQDKLVRKSRRPVQQAQRHHWNETI